MRTKVPVILLIVLCLGLGGALIVRHNRAVEQKQADEARILQLSKDQAKSSADLAAQKEANVVLSNQVTQLTARAVDADKLNQQLKEAATLLAQVEAEAKAASNAVKNAEQELLKRDARIAELETKNAALDKQALELKAAITGLEAEIAETQRKLAASEGDRDFLLKELKRLQTEKTELERQFNDLSVLQQQLRKLKDDLAVNRRLDWARKGLRNPSEMKGGERLQRSSRSPEALGRTNTALEVEINRDGRARIVTPTNAPARNP